MIPTTDYNFNVTITMPSKKQGQVQGMVEQALSYISGHAVVTPVEPPQIDVEHTFTVKITANYSREDVCSSLKSVIGEHFNVSPWEILDEPEKKFPTYEEFEKWLYGDNRTFQQIYNFFFGLWIV